MFNQQAEVSPDGVVDAKVEIRKKEFSIIDPEKLEEELPIVREEQKEIVGEEKTAQNKYFDIKLTPFYELKQ